MRLNWRASAVAAGAAFVVSLLAGIIAGVPVGTLLFRAAVGAVVFGTGAAGTSVVIDRYLPDLKPPVAGGDEGSGEQPPGSNVDIVVDGDPMDAEGDASLLLEDGGDGEQETAAAGEFSPGIAAEQVDAGLDRAGYDASDDEEEPAELEATYDAGDVSPEAVSSDSLPDMDGFTGSFEGSATEMEDVEETERSGEDPNIMARAIRTVLKRDE